MCYVHACVDTCTFRYVLGIFRGDLIFVVVLRLIFMEAQKLLMIHMAYSYGGGPEPRKLNLQIISVIQVRALPRKLSPAKNISYTVCNSMKYSNCILVIQYFASQTVAGERRAHSGLWREGSGGLHCSGLLPGAGGSRLAH